MCNICFYFQVHQPKRVRAYTSDLIGRDHRYFDDFSGGRQDNRKIFAKVASLCYFPANDLFLDMLRAYPQLHISYSISGIFLEQAAEYLPGLIESFKRLVDTGRVELIGETYYHSLSYLASFPEFVRQVNQHTQLIHSLFGVTPQVFRNTELIYNNQLAYEIQTLGYRGLITEGADHILNGRSPNVLYTPTSAPALKLLLKNYQFSDDMSFRFAEPLWAHYPLLAETFSDWITQLGDSADVLNLFMDYETFGEHQSHSTGIFDFLYHLPRFALAQGNQFVTPSQAIDKFPARDLLDVPQFISWADEERDLSAWLGNSMQDTAFKQVYALESAVLASDKPDVIADWRRLQSSDHFYYMCIKHFNDGDIHKYFSPYLSPQQAYEYYSNALTDLKSRLDPQP